jgi:hypothetical protein
MEFGQLLAAGVATGSGMAVVWYIVRVLVKAGRDPTRLGAWLPDCWLVGTLE